MVMKAPNFRTLDLNLLRLFDEVMAERNLTRAARNLAMTQPAVSNALNRLRNALGDKLVVRSGYGVQPTARALTLWPAIADALRQMEASLSPGDFVASEAKTTFVLAMADATAAELMPGLVEIMERDAPGVTMRVLPLTTRDPRPLLDEGQMDLAVGFFPAVVADLTAQAQAHAGGLAAFDHQRLFEGEYVCVMRQGHPLARGPLTLQRYCDAHHLLVSFSGRPFGFVDEALAALGHQRRIVLTVNQFFTAGRVVVSSDLLTVLPRHFVRMTGMAHEFVLRELPLAVPPVLVDSLWHRRQGQRSDHAWLRLAVAAAAQKAFAVEADEIAAGSSGAQQPTARRPSAQ
jgi:DNA-binding transcriptional LysR family regulator